MSGNGRPAIDLTGRRFGRLVVIGRSKRRVSERNEALWDCRCDCGTVNMVLGRNLNAGRTRSCGCLRNELSAMRCARTRTTTKTREV